MIYREACKCCGNHWYSLSDNGLVYTCFNCSDVTEYFDGSELTMKVINAISNGDNCDDADCKKYDEE